MSNTFGIVETSDKFSPKRMIAVTKRVLRQLTRDKRTFGMIIGMPIIIMLVFGVALSGDVKNVPIIIQNEDVSYEMTIQISPTSNISKTFDIGRNFTETILTDDRVDVDQSESDWDKAIDMVEDGDFRAAIRVPANFSQLFAEKQLDPDVQLEFYVYMDGTKPSLKASILGAIQDALQKALGGQPFDMELTLAYGGKEYEGLDVAIPGVMALVLTFLMLLISLITIIRDKAYGTQSRLYSTPLSKLERLLGFVLALSVIGMIMVFSVILMGTVLFGAKVRGNFILLILSAFLFAATHIFLAVFLSNFAENELQAVQFAPLIAFPSMALSGMLVPISTFPRYAQVLSNFIPMTYGIKLFEGIMLKGYSFGNLWLEYLILCAFLLISFTLAVLTVKDKLD